MKDASQKPELEQRMWRKIFIKFQKWHSNIIVYFLSLIIHEICKLYSQNDGSFDARVAEQRPQTSCCSVKAGFRNIKTQLAMPGRFTLHCQMFLCPHKDQRKSRRQIHLSKYVATVGMPKVVELLTELKYQI